MRRRSRLRGLVGLPAGTDKVVVHPDLEVPMRDDVVLHADRIVPEGRVDAPVLLIRSAYGRGQPWRWLYGRTFAGCGVQVVIASCRGTGDTGGQPDPFAEGEDGTDNVAWLRAQPWYPGRLVLAAPSYMGMAQWALVDAVPSEELVAVAAILTSSRLARSVFGEGRCRCSGWTGVRWSPTNGHAAPASRRCWLVLFAAVVWRARSAICRCQRPTASRPVERCPGGSSGWRTPIPTMASGTTVTGHRPSPDSAHPS